MRGAFIRADGLVIPNNITTAGAAAFLRSIVQAEPLEFWMGLCDAIPQPALRLDALNEPTLGVGSYGRGSIARNSVGWPVVESSLEEAYAESASVTFVAVGIQHDKQLRRLFLTTSEDSLTSDVLCLSAAVPAPYVITPTTPLPERTFKYRIYLR